MKVLADSSIWINHFRKADENLLELLADGDLAMHQFVLSELALGSVPDRQRLIQHLRSLPILGAPETDLLAFIDEHGLHGTGIGYVDAVLLQSCTEHKAAFWTADKRLALQAKRIGLQSGR